MTSSRGSVEARTEEFLRTRGPHDHDCKTPAFCIVCAVRAKAVPPELIADRQRAAEFAQLFRLYRELGNIDRADIAALIELSHACSLRVLPAAR